MIGRRRYLQSVAAAGAALAGCTADGDGATVETTDSLTFEPATLAVDVGDSVTWDNVGTSPHTVTAYGDRLPAGAAFFDSGGFETEAAARAAYPTGRLVGGDSYSHTFDVGGTYPYFCIPHERAGMRGTIEVG